MLKHIKATIQLNLTLLLLSILPSLAPFSSLVLEDIVAISSLYKYDHKSCRHDSTARMFTRWPQQQNLNKKGMLATATARIVRVPGNRLNEIALIVSSVN